LQFQALWLRYAEDLRVEEIARVLRKTQTHVKVLLFRARTFLGHELEQRRASEEVTGRTTPGDAKPPANATQRPAARLRPVVTSSPA
jgi:RNA polymerase sigma-70 factor (ECF subfamily)